jgi:hypothetical protein
MKRGAIAFKLVWIRLLLKMMCMTNQPSNLEAQLEALRQEAQKVITLADTLERLEELRVFYLGKKGQLSALLRSMGQMSAEERPRIGAIANTVKEALQSELERQRTALQTARIEAQLEAENTGCDNAWCLSSPWSPSPTQQHS